MRDDLLSLIVFMFFIMFLVVVTFYYDSKCYCSKYNDSDESVERFYEQNSGEQGD